MEEDNIKSLRASFTNPHREDMPKPLINKFGHTILNGTAPTQESEMNLNFDESGAIVAEPKQSLFDSPEFQKWAEKQPILKLSESKMEEESEHTEHSQQNISANGVNIADLISELDEMDGTTERKQFENQWFKNCVNQDCKCNLPKDAKFCLKCGTPQMPKFCTECGYSFPGTEKFCPDCGNKR